MIKGLKPNEKDNTMLKYKKQFFQNHIGQRTYSVFDFPKRKTLIGMINSTAILDYDDEELEILTSYDLMNPRCALKIQLRSIVHLKPDHISDLCKILNWNATAAHYQWWNSMEYSVLESLECPLPVFDYLRSKGYALPWQGISVEKQLELGWIILEPPS